MLRRVLCAAFVGLLLAGQERIDSVANERIRREAMENSQLLRTIHYLCDVVGSRLTGSPQYRQAIDWAKQQAESWGLVNVHVEAWDFGRDGWSNERAAAFVTTPFKE